MINWEHINTRNDIKITTPHRLFFFFLLLSLFGFILAIGIVVDDAIVIGENIYTANKRGIPPIEAAIRGAQRVSIPVMFAVATTIVAFSPLIFVPGESGKFLGQMPIVVIILLLLSLLEAMLILPFHLSQYNFIDIKTGKKQSPNTPNMSED